MSNENTGVQSIVATEADFGPLASLAPIKEYFCNQSSEYWSEVKGHLLAGYITIPNKQAWNRDFILGGTDFACLTPLIFEPYSYKQDYEKFNAYGNLFMGDCISILNSCTQFGIKRMDVLDFGIVALFVAAALTWNSMKTRTKAVRSPSVDWIVRCFLSALTKHNDASDTEINLHITDYFSTCGQFSDFMRNVNEFARGDEIDAVIKSGCYQSLVVSAYFSLISGLNTRANFRTPNLTVHELKATAKEQYLIKCCSEENMEYLVTKEICRKGIAKFCEDKQGRIVPGLTYVNGLDDTVESPYFPNPYCTRIHNYLHTRKKKPPEFLTVVYDNPCRQSDKLPKTPIASCTIDINKLAFHNATKEDIWMLSTALLQYSYAQEINKLRRSFQSDGKDNPLLVKVILPKSRPELVEKLKDRINMSNSILRSTYDLDYTYEFIESK